MDNNPYKPPSALSEPLAVRTTLRQVCLDIVAVTCAAFGVAYQLWAYTVFESPERGPPFDFYRDVVNNTLGIVAVVWFCSGIYNVSGVIGKRTLPKVGIGFNATFVLLWLALAIFQYFQKYGGF